MIQVVGGIAAGAAAMMLAPSIVTTLAGILKPVAKTLIKGGILAFEGGRELVHKSHCALAEAAEQVEDLAAEAKAEVHEAKKAPAKASRKKEA